MTRHRSARGSRFSDITPEGFRSLPLYATERPLPLHAPQHAPPPALHSQCGVHFKVWCTHEHFTHPRHSLAPRSSTAAAFHLPSSLLFRTPPNMTHRPPIIMDNGTGYTKLGYAGMSHTTFSNALQLAHPRQATPSPPSSSPRASQLTTASALRRRAPPPLKKVRVHTAAAIVFVPDLCLTPPPFRSHR